MISKTRKSLGLSQSKLAEMSQVSLATLQGIEAGRTNPTLQTLNQILNVLGCEIQVVESTYNFSHLISLGAPLLKSEESHSKDIIQSQSNLICHLKLALRYIERTSKLPKHQTEADTHRKVDAVSAMLLVLKLHYSKIYTKYFNEDHFSKALVEQANLGRHIKLYRIAKAQMGTYL